VLPCVAVCCRVLPCIAVCCSVLQCVAVCCRVLQGVAGCNSVLRRILGDLIIHMRVCVSLSLSANVPPIIKSGACPKEALSLQVIFRRRALRLESNLQKETFSQMCNRL